MAGLTVVAAGAGVLVVASGDADVGAGVGHVRRGRVGVVGVIGIVPWPSGSRVIAIGPLAIVGVRHAKSDCSAEMGDSLAGLILIYFCSG